MHLLVIIVFVFSFIRLVIHENEVLLSGMKSDRYGINISTFGFTQSKLVETEISAQF